MGVSAHKPIDFLSLSSTAHPSVEGEAFSKHILDIHDKEGDEVMVRIRPERYTKGVYKKLHSGSAGPFKILKKISSNAYVLELPEDMGISNIFNIENLTSYAGHQIDPKEKITIVSLPPTLVCVRKYMKFLTINLCQLEVVATKSILFIGRGVHVLIVHGLLMHNLGN
ncbi:hypothetical protein ACH5RR_026179 [Cinchona calisaya]|uniref:Tf2-1-like SH3-like domain-containing protein n=1 Tax=Cinchona calisaya TaxID=153742 RepID=A0ABD2Z1S6_9GENT